MIANLQQFQRRVNAFAKSIVQEELPKLQRFLSLRLLTELVNATPVDFGFARANWQVTVNVPAAGTVSGNVPADQVISQGQSRLVNLRPFQVVYLTNNTPYILVLDQGGFMPPDPGPSKDKRKGRKGRVLVRGGYSVQAPIGMTAIAFQRVAGDF